MSDKKPSWIKRYREMILTTLGLMFAMMVAGVTGWSSWGHIVHVGRLVGEPNADLLPVAIDGLMLTGTVMAAVDRLKGYATRPWASVALVVGSALTLAFNLASAWERGLFAMLIAVLYAVALLVTVETMFHPSHRLLSEVRERREARNERRLARKGVAAPVVPVPVPTAPIEQTAPETVKTAEGPQRPGRKPGVPQTPPMDENGNPKRRASPNSTPGRPHPRRKPKAPTVQAVTVSDESEVPTTDTPITEAVAA